MKKIAFALLTIFSLFVISCEIGLGASVDTDPPSLNISNPPVDAIIRDDFALSGTWTDDGEIGSIAVELSRTDGNGEKLSYTGTFAEDSRKGGSGTWSIDIPAKSSSITDGTYQAVVTIKDATDRTTIQNTTFTIDNTAPIIVLQRPGTDLNASLANADTYGQLFTLEGLGADDNNIDHIDIDIYADKNKTQKKNTSPITLKNVPPSISLNVAKYGDETYTAIYGNVSSSNIVPAQFYCTINAYDGAQSYPSGREQTDEDKLGNHTDTYYLYEDISESILNDIKITELYHILSGKSVDLASRSARSHSEIIQILNSNGKTTGSFVLDPKNNPTFSVIGLNKSLVNGESMKDEQDNVITTYELTNGSGDSGVTLSINITPGRDNYPINKDSVEIYLQECDKDGNLNLDATPIPLGSGVTSLKTNVISSVNYTGLKTGLFYRVCVNGIDTRPASTTNDNKIEEAYTSDGNAQIYAFYLAPLNGVIELTTSASPWGNNVTNFEPITKYISSETTDDDYKKLKVTLTYSYTGGSQEDSLNVYRQWNSSLDSGDDIGTMYANNQYVNSTALEQGTDKTWSETIDASLLKAQNVNQIYYTLSNMKTVTGTNGAVTYEQTNWSRSRSVTVSLDDNPPQVTSIICPEAKKTSESSFRFEGTVSDTGSGINEVIVKIEDEENSKSYVEHISSTGSWSFTVSRDSDFTSTTNPSYGGVFAVDGQKKITVTAVDKVGLKSPPVSETFNYKATKPSFRLEGYKPIVGDEEQSEILQTTDLLSDVTTAKSFSVGTKYKLLGTFDDEYGITSITCTKGTSSTPVTVTKDDTNKTWYIIENSLPGENQTQINTYHFSITDRAGISYSAKDVVVTIDRKKPTLEINAPAPASSYFGDNSISGTAYTFRGTASDENGMAKIKYAIVPMGVTVSDTDWQEFSVTSDDWSFTMNLGTNTTGSEIDTADTLYEGKKTVHVIALDKAGNASEEATKDFCVDQSVPEFEYIRVYAGTSTAAKTAEIDGSYIINVADNVNNFYIAVKAKDASGIKDVTAAGLNFEFADTVSEWKSEPITTEEKYNYTIVLEDKSGNSTTNGKKSERNLSVVFDKSSPVITVTGASTTSADAPWKVGTGTQYLTGTATDTGNSGIMSQEIKFPGDTNWRTMTATGDWSYEMNFDSLEEDTESSYKTVYVRITDKAGNKNAENGVPYYFRHDKGAPTLTMTINKDYINDGTFKISGTVYDGDNRAAGREVDTLLLTATKDGTPISTTFKLDNESSKCGNYSYTIDTSADGYNLAEGNYVFTLKATDIANKDTSKNVNIIIDKLAPSFTIIKAKRITGEAEEEIPAETDNSGRWYSSQSIALRVEAEDSSSGIDSIEWATSKADGTERTDYEALSKKFDDNTQTTYYSGTAVFSDAAATEGARLYIRATDKAGNSTDFATKKGAGTSAEDIAYILMDIDTTSPVLPLNSVKYRVGNGTEEPETVSGIVSINNSAKLTVYGNYKDPQSGVQPLTFSGLKAGAAQPTIKYSTVENSVTDTDFTISSITDANKKTIRAWKAEFNNSTLTTGVLSVTGKNNSGAGLTTPLELFNINKDEKAPEIKRYVLQTDSDVYSVYEHKAERTNSNNETELYTDYYYINNGNSERFTISGLAEDNNDGASQASGIRTVELWVSTDGGLNYNKLEDKDNTILYFNDLNFSVYSTSSIKVKIVVYDKADNKADVVIPEIKFDTAAPVGVHAFDGKQKDLYFRFGKANRSEDDGTSSNPPNDINLDNNVGGKYAADSYGNLETQDIRGTFVDKARTPETNEKVKDLADGSGVSLIYYKIFDHEPSDSELSAFESGYKTDVDRTGYFSPKSDTKRVFFTPVSGILENSIGQEITATTVGSQKYTNITSSYQPTIAGLQQGSNYLVLLAVDKVGNAALENIKLWDNTTVNNYRINVDQTAPSISVPSKDRIYSNAVSGKEITGRYLDAGAWLKTKEKNGLTVTVGTETTAIKADQIPDKVTGISLLNGATEFTSNDLINSEVTEDKYIYNYLKKSAYARIKINDSYYYVTNTDSPRTSGRITFTPAFSGTSGTYDIEFGGGEWKATIPDTTLNNYVGQSVTISGHAIDNAGNSTTEPVVATIVVDKEYPSVEIDSLKSTINGVVTLRVRASDNNGLKIVKLQYKKDGDSGFTDYVSKSENITNPWDVNVDTTESVFENTKQFTFRAIAEDYAGNIGNSGNTTTAFDTAKEKETLISKDSDRPVIIFNNLNLASMDSSSGVVPCNTTTLRFTVEDDDGQIAEAAVSYKEGNGEWKTTESAESKLTYEDGLFTLAGIGEGAQSLSFKVTDHSIRNKTSTTKENKVFEIGAEDALDSPKIKDSNDNYYTSNEDLKLKVDTQEPDVIDVKYHRLTNVASYSAGDWIDVAGSSGISSEYFGGPDSNYQNKFRLSLYAFDANEDETNGLTVTLSIPENAGDKTGAVRSYALALATDSVDGLPKEKTSNGYKFRLYTCDVTINDKLTTSDRECIIDVTEGVSHNRSKKFTLCLDTNAPVFDLRYPSKTKSIVGDVEITGKIDDPGKGLLKEVKYFIPTFAQSTTLEPKNVTAWTEISDSSNLNLKLPITAATLNTKIGYPSGASYSDYSGYIKDGLYKLPVWLYLEDELGNIGYDKESIEILYNADADTPIVEIVDPVHNLPENNPTYVIKGATVTISGTAQDNEEISDVYLQFDMNGDGIFENGKNADGTTMEKAPNLVLGEIPNSDIKFGGAKLKGVKANKRNSGSVVRWTKDIDISEFDDNTVINVRAVSIDNKTGTAALVSAWSPVVCIHVENSKPIFTVLKMRRYSAAINSTTANDTGANNYELQKDVIDKMYLKTQNEHWYIYGEVKVQSSNHIKEISSSKDASGFKWTCGTTPGVGDYELADKGYTWTTDSGRTHKFLIPVEGSVDGLWETKISVEGSNDSESENKNNTEIRLNIDNTKPVFNDRNESDTANKGDIKLRMNPDDDSSFYESASTGTRTLNNSNTQAVVAGAFTESGSGFEKLVFYFVRNNNVYNVMENNTSASITTLAEGAAKVSGNVYLTDEELPALYMENGTRGSGDETGEYKHDSIKNNPNIRIGGLIKIGNDYRIISAVDYTNGKVTFSPECKSTYKTAEFVYGMVVDKSNEDATHDDGDAMRENYRTGDPSVWDASIDSRNIPDGRIEIHCVIFDNAGNSKHGWTKTFVSNKPPRITSLKLGTDLNKDGDYADSEFKQFWFNESKSLASGTDIWDLSAYLDDSQTEYWTAKKDLVVIPEFVGGNGDIYYAYSKLAATSTEAQTHAVAAVTRNAASKLKKKVKDSDVNELSSTQEGNNVFAFILTNGTNDAVGTIGTSGDYKKNSDGTIANAGVNIYHFTFNDSTNNGDDAQWCILNAKFKQDITDDTAPTGSITPFYWTGNDGESVIYETDNGKLVAKGHIELAEDWTAQDAGGNYLSPGYKKYKNNTTGYTGAEYDADPKVSGKIKIEGVAYDETMLKTITISLGDKSVTASYDSSNGWTYNPSTQPASFMLEVTDADANAPGATQSGHSVKWSLIVDTSLVITNSTTGLDKTILVTINDAATTANTTSTSQKVDIVPYITGLGTRLDQAYSANTSVFNRSANGNYPVMRGETGVKLYGFNLAGANTTVRINGKSVGTVTAGTTTDYVTFTVPNTNNNKATSGTIDVIVSSVSALNNENKADAVYNLEPNNINNNTLDDNRSVWVWGMNDVLTNTVKTIRYPTFRIGKDANQTVGFVYDRDGQTVWYHRNNGTATNKQLDKSFSQWYATACAVDSSGHLYASAQNGDSGGGGNITNNYSYANYKFYARAETVNGTYYDDEGGAYSQGGNNVALESCIGNGSTFFAERIQNPKIATLGSDTTKMYTVYYDISYPRIVFRYGEASGAVNFSTANGMGIKARTNSSAGNARVIDDSANVGEYAAVGVIPNELTGQTGGTAVVCWNADNKLKFKYNEAPTGNTWSDTIIIDDDYAGEYCDLAVDAAGGIHIAYYRAGNKLKYAYLESYKDTVADVCLVDSYLSVGENISIETSSKTISYTENGVAKTRYVPYISYYSSAIGMAKVAWPVKLGTNGSKANTFVNGVNNDMFTGDWEVQVLPTALTTKLLNYTIGVGEKTNGSANSVMLGYGTKTGLQTALLY
ncbi:hypothetical protein [Treponema bryantii]|uniref:hypothetical protein n=1 Tax=Treponema bryantii TaxID=163 RepID=UPI0003B54F16|nr:hypothetical protein [Treponema bryantii]